MEGAIDIFTVDAVFIRRQRYWANGYRPVAKWNPGAIDRNGEPIRNAGKASKGASWRDHALENPPAWCACVPIATRSALGFCAASLSQSMSMSTTRNSATGRRIDRAPHWSEPTGAAGPGAQSGTLLPRAEGVSSDQDC